MSAVERACETISAEQVNERTDERVALCFCLDLCLYGFSEPQCVGWNTRVYIMYKNLFPMSATGRGGESVVERASIASCVEKANE